LDTDSSYSRLLHQAHRIKLEGAHAANEDVDADLTQISDTITE